MPPMLTSGQASKGEMGKDVEGSREKKRDFSPPLPFFVLATQANRHYGVDTARNLLRP